jgi:hypothetical protein
MSLFGNALVAAFTDEIEKISSAASRQVRQHFSKKQKGDKWGTFGENVKSKDFLSELSKHPKADKKLIRHAKSLHALHQGSTVGTVPSKSGKGKYEIRRLPSGKLGCTCKDWHYKGTVKPSHKCKHIKAHEDMATKTAASSKVVALLRSQARKGIRPMRVSTLLKKLGENTMKTDPLVQYLKKQAAILEDNLKDMKTGPEEHSMADESPLPTQRLVDRGRVRGYLSEQFGSTEGIRKKFTEKEHEVKMPE